MALGKKTGGRKKGSRNKTTRAAVIAASGLTPLEYMLGVLRDPEIDAHRRDDMAKAAAPYCHARLAQAEAKPAQSDIKPLAERLRDYVREDAIEASKGKVVALNGSQAQPRLERRNPADIDETAS